MHLWWCCNWRWWLLTASGCRRCHCSGYVLRQLIGIAAAMIAVVKADCQVLSYLETETLNIVSLLLNLFSFFVWWNIQHAFLIWAGVRGLRTLAISMQLFPYFSYSCINIFCSSGIHLPLFIGPRGAPTTCHNQHGASRSYSFGQVWADCEQIFVLIPMWFLCVLAFLAGIQGTRVIYPT